MNIQSEWNVEINLLPLIVVNFFCHQNELETCKKNNVTHLICI
jgi:hypothetical protein